MMAFSAHKLYGPKGVGALYVRRRGPRVKIIAQMDGGGHERGIRSGTLNVPAIAGFGKACELAAAEMAAVADRLSAMRDRLETTILAREHATVNGSGAPRLPHVTNIGFHGMQGDALLRSISRQIAVSSGSACTSANPEPSHVLLAMGVEDELARSSLRFALGRYTTDAEIDFAIAAVDNTIREFNEILK
jgi:cysteine desulfurase